MEEQDPERAAPSYARETIPEPPAPVATHPGRRPRLRWTIWLLVAAAAASGLALWLDSRGGRAVLRARSAADAPPDIQVGAATVTTGDIPVTLNALGTVTPLATVTVKSQISGQITEIRFQEGQMVKKGDLLAVIDTRPYAIALSQAEAQLARDQALLRNAELDLARYQKLKAQDSIAGQQVDTQRYLVAQDQAAVLSDQAAVNSAKLNLDYCHITAPVEGRVGLRLVDQGNYIQVGDATGIVVITQIHPITVVFTLPEDNLPAVMKQLKARAAMPVAAYDRSMTSKLADGHLATFDNEIDTTTGTVKLKAEFDNLDDVLFPNQFVNAKLLVDTLRGVAVVPRAAVLHGAPGNYVYLLKPNDTVAVRTVTVGPADGERIAITAGLAPGDRVVVDGTDRLREGAKVTIAGAPPATGGRKSHRSKAEPASP